MSRKFSNSKTDKYLDTLSQYISLDNDDCDLSKRSKFNFSYFCDDQKCACSIDEWGGDNSSAFLKKLIELSKHSLLDLRRLPIGSGRKRRNILEVYQQYPSHSNFSRPVHVPHQAEWARIRLDSATRLIGFVSPDDYHGAHHQVTSYQYDKNTFYVVFIDKNHNFYPTKK